MSSLREKGKIPPSSDCCPGAFPIPEPPARRSEKPRRKGRDSSPGALPIPKPRAQPTGSENLGQKGKLPASSVSGPGAFPIPIPRAQRSAHSLQPPNALSPSPEPEPESISFDEEEGQTEDVAQGEEGETEEDNISGSSNIDIADNSPAAFEACAYAVQDEEDVRDTVYAAVYEPPPVADEPRKWYERPMSRGCIAKSSFLVLLLVVGVVALVLYLTKAIGSPPAPPTSLSPEEIACNFLSMPNLTECRSTSLLNFGDNVTGSTIPSEIGLLTQLARLDFNLDSLAGTIPTEIGLLTQLTYLVFSYNAITGTIPTEIGLLTQLTYLWFTGNRLSGVIPSDIGNLTKIMGLAFSYNSQLSGTIPSSMCSLSPIYIRIDCGEVACTPGCCWSETAGKCP